MYRSDYELVLLLQQVQAVEPERLTPIFERHGVAATAGIESLVAEIRRDGSNTISTLFRGGDGVHYAEIVADVARASGCTVREGASVQELESLLVEKVMSDYYRDCKPEERASIQEFLMLHGEKAAKKSAMDAGVKGATNAALLLALRYAGVIAIRQVVQRIVAWQLTRVAAYFAAKRAANLALAAVPVVGWAMAAWAVNDLFDAAMRKTVPTVIEVAFLRWEFTT